MMGKDKLNSDGVAMGSNEKGDRIDLRSSQSENIVQGFESIS